MPNVRFDAGAKPLITEFSEESILKSAEPLSNKFRKMANVLSFTHDAPVYLFVNGEKIMEVKSGDVVFIDKIGS